MIINPYLVQPSGPSYGTLTTAWIAATGETDLTILGALNTLESDLTTYGLTAKMKGLYPFVGGTASKHKYNFMDARDLDAAFRLVFTGGWTHSSTGGLSNGINAYANSFIFPLSLNDFGYGFYGYRSTFEPKAQMGAEYGAGITYLYSCYNSGAAMYSNINGTGQKTTTGTFANVNGFYSVSRTDASTVLTRAVNTTASFAVSGGTLQNNLPMFIGAASYLSAGDDYCNTEFRGAFIGNGLTATESGNLKTAFDTFNTTLGRHVGVPIVSDSDAQAFLNAAVITDTTQASAINTLVTGLKADGLWTKMKAIYPFVGGTATAHKWNLKDPQDTNAAFRLTFNGGITHSSSGVKGNSTNGYYETYLNPSTEFSLATGGSGFVSTNEDIDTLQDFGAFQSGVNYRFSLAIRASNVLYSAMLSNAFYSTANTNSNGFFGVTRPANDNTNFYTIINTNNYVTADAYSEPNSNINGFCLNIDNGNRQNFGNRRQSFACFAEGITTTQAQNLRTAVNTFNTTLGR